MQEFLKNVIKEAGEVALSYFNKVDLKMREKGDERDIVTEADEAVSEFLVTSIHKNYPDHHICSEEMAEDINPGAEYEWVMDPIDGTWVFANGLPTWGIMIAVLKNGEPYLSAVYFPVYNDLFFAEKNKGAFLNDKKISVNNMDLLDRANGILFRATPGTVYGDYFEKYRSLGAKLILDYNCHSMNFGSAAFLCYVASGVFGYAGGNAGLAWDLIPPFLICSEAGAVITDSDGNPWKRGRQDYIMANPEIHPQIMKLFKEL